MSSYLQALNLLFRAVSSETVTDAEKKEAQVLKDMLKNLSSPPGILIRNGLGAVRQGLFGIHLLYFICFCGSSPSIGFHFMYKEFELSKWEPYRVENEGFLHCSRQSRGPDKKCAEHFPVPFLGKTLVEKAPVEIRTRLMRHICGIKEEDLQTLVHRVFQEINDPASSTGAMESLIGEMNLRYSSLNADRLLQLEAKLESLYLRLRQFVPDLDPADVNFKRDLTVLMNLLDPVGFIEPPSQRPKIEEVSDDPAKSPLSQLANWRSHWIAFIDLYVECLLYKFIPELIYNSERLTAILEEFKRDRISWFQRYVFLKGADYLPGEALCGLLDCSHKFNSLISEPYSNGFFVKAYYQVLANHVRECKSLQEISANDFTKRPVGSFTSLCQSSGTGKTKLLLSLGSEALVFYLCLRENGTSGAPGPSKIRDYFLSLKCPVKMNLFNMAILDAFAEGVTIHGTIVSYLDYAVSLSTQSATNPLQCFSQLLADPDSSLHLIFWESVKRHHTVLLNARHAELVSDPATLQAKAAERARLQNTSVLSKSFIPGVIERACTKFNRVKDVIDGASRRMNTQLNSEFFILALDESRSALNGPSFEERCYEGSCLQAVKSGSRHLSGTGIIIFCDSNTCVSKFAPVKQFDASLRDVTEYDLFKPNLHIPILGVAKVRSAIRDLPGAICSSSPVDARYKILKYNIFDEVDRCRGLFPSHISSLENVSNDQVLSTYESLVNLITSKIGIRVNLDHMERLKFIDLPKHLASAIGCCLFGVSFTNRELVDSLMASFMAIGMDLSDSRNRLRISYLGEPCLAEVFCRILLKKIEGVRFLGRVIQDMLRKVDESLISPESGPLGEHLVAFIIIWAMVRKRRTLRLSNPITVNEFLQSLLRADLVSELEASDQLGSILNSFVCCTSTFKFKTKYTKPKVLEAFRRRVLVATKPAEKGVDLLIPVVLNETKADGADSLPLDCRTISIIPVQVKNHNPAKPLTDARAKTILDRMISSCGERGFAPKLAIIFYIGGTVTSNKVIYSNECACLVLDMDCIASDLFTASEVTILKKLINFCRSTPDQTSRYYAALSDPVRVVNLLMDHESPMERADNVDPTD